MTARNSEELWMRFGVASFPDFLGGGHLLLFGADAGWANWSGVSRSVRTRSVERHAEHAMGPPAARRQFW